MAARRGRLPAACCLLPALDRARMPGARRSPCGSGWRFHMKRWRPALEALRSIARDTASGMTEGIILSTCHRLECYAVARDAEAGREALIAIPERYARRSGGGVRAASRLSQLIRGVVDHLFALAAGLASPVLGDSQILGQVSDAYAAAQSAGTAGPVLAALFQRAMHAAKRVHSETTLNRRVSVGYTGAAIALRATTRACNRWRSSSARGRWAQRAAWYLHKHDAGRILIANRTPERARELAARVNGEAVPWEHVCRTPSRRWTSSSPRPPRRRRSCGRTTSRRRCARGPDRPLALRGPRRAARHRASRRRACRNVQRRDGGRPRGRWWMRTRRSGEAEIPRAEAILAAGKADFARWQAARAVTPIISAMRDEAERIRAAELRRFLQRDGIRRRRCRAARCADEGHRQQTAASPDRAPQGDVRLAGRALRRRRGRSLRRVGSRADRMGTRTTETLRAPRTRKGFNGVSPGPWCSWLSR